MKTKRIRTENKLFKILFKPCVTSIHQRQIAGILEMKRKTLTGFNLTKPKLKRKTKPENTRAIALFTNSKMTEKNHKNWIEECFEHRAETHLSYAKGNEFEFMFRLWLSTHCCDFEWKRKTKPPVKLFQTARRSELYWRLHALPSFVRVVCLVAMRRACCRRGTDENNSMQTRCVANTDAAEQQ